MATLYERATQLTILRPNEPVPKGYELLGVKSAPHHYESRHMAQSRQALKALARQWGCNALVDYKEHTIELNHTLKHVAQGRLGLLVREVASGGLPKAELLAQWMRVCQEASARADQLARLQRQHHRFIGFVFWMGILAFSGFAIHFLGFI